MPLTPEDIISGLVSYYRRTGVDMTSLLGDPTWQAMKVADKIEAIKRHAGEIHAGSHDSLTSGEKKFIATDAVMNAWPVLPAIATLALHGPIMKVLPGIQGKTLIGLGLGGAAIGLSVGAIQAYIQAKQAQDYRQAVRANLQNVARNPTTTNALGVLATDNIRRQQFSAKDAILQRIRQELAENFHPGEWVTKTYPEELKSRNNSAIAQQNFLDAAANSPDFSN